MAVLRFWRLLPEQKSLVMVPLLVHPVKLTGVMTAPWNSGERPIVAVFPAPQGKKLSAPPVELTMHWLFEPAAAVGSVSTKVAEVEPATIETEPVLELLNVIVPARLPTWPTSTTSPDVSTLKIILLFDESWI